MADRAIPLYATRPRLSQGPSVKVDSISLWSLTKKELTLKHSETVHIDSDSHTVHIDSDSQLFHIDSESQTVHIGVTNSSH